MKNKTTKNSNKMLIFSNIFFVVLSIIFIILFINKNNENKNNRLEISHDQDNTYSLTSPILDCENYSQGNDTSVYYNDVKNKVSEIESKYGLTQMSVYFRDLNNGSWIGVKEKEVFSPASLLKVPVLMSLYHDAESDKSLLNKVIKITPDDISNNFTPNIKDTGAIELGKEYTLDQIANSMIIKSDNNAVLTLFHNINNDNITNVFKSISVPFDNLSNEVDISVKEYAGFFRVLYNASYLDRDMSEKALELMSKSDYNDGLVAGVPKGITVSHKFGERTLDNDKNTTQLHDCGIIYYPNMPYILCIMTRGTDLKMQSEAIRDMSAYIYNEVGKNK